LKQKEMVKKETWSIRSKERTMGRVKTWVNIID
jgi:hypothetical protein